MVWHGHRHGRAQARSFPFPLGPKIATILSAVARACSAGMATSLPVVAVACCSCSLVLLLLELAVSGSGCLPGMGIARPARGPRAGNGPAPSHSTPGWPQTPDHPLCYVEKILRGCLGVADAVHALGLSMKSREVVGDPDL